MKKDTPKNILIFGATSAMAQHTARIWAQQKARFFLVARNANNLESVADDLKARGAAQVEVMTADFEDFDRHENIVETAFDRMKNIDVVLFAHGVLGDQEAAQKDYAVTENILRVNFLSVVSLLTPLAEKMEKQGGGKIIVISSVAGDRGRQSNYVYGASKGALDIFLQGLRNRLSPAGVDVLVVKPGFVDTPMTADFPKNPLFVGPEVIARGIVDAERKGKYETYLPFYWRFIMLIIKSIPEFIFKRLKL